MIKIINQVLAAEQKVDIGTEVTKGNFFGYTCIWNLVSNVASVALILSAVVVFIMLISGGIQWLTSGGDKGKIETAQKMISNAIIGLVIVAASWAIYTLVLSFLGIDLGKICSTDPV